MRAIHVFPSFGLGLQQRCLASIARGSEGAWSHHILSFSDELEGLSEMPAGSAGEVFAAHRKGTPLIPNPVGLRQRLQQLGGDLLCTYGHAGLEAAAANLAGPRLPHIHYADIEVPAEDVGPSARRMRSAALADSYIVVPSAPLAALARKVWKLPADRIRMIPNGIDFAQFNRDPRITEDRPRVTIGASGTLSLDSDFGLLIRAFSTMRARFPADLAIFGDGPARPEFESLARAGGARDRVYFLAALTEGHAAFADLDVFVAAEASRMAEITVMQAMASGLPVLGTGGPDLRAVLSSDNARLIPRAGDAGGFATALTRLVNSPELRRQLGSENRERVRRDFDIREIVAAHLALFQEAVDSHLRRL